MCCEKEPPKVGYSFVYEQDTDFLPLCSTKGAACMDLRAYTANERGGVVILYPGETRLVCTNIRVSIPAGYKMEVKSRSGLALKGVFVANAPGVIDSDYRGEVGVILHNTSNHALTIRHKDRIAQLDLSKVCTFEWSHGVNMKDSDRGDSGFGSTGYR